MAPARDTMIALLPGYTVTEEVCRSRGLIVYLATRDQDRACVVLKTPAEGSGAPGALRREFELIQALHLEGVPRAVDLVSTGEQEILLLEDAGRTCLKTLISGDGMDPGAFLRLAIQLAEVVRGLHHRKLIHKDINPSHVLVDPETGRLTLVDFSLASRMQAEHQELRHPSVLEGTIAYLSPEQTGRMDRDIDYRTDFYSLGVTFYEMLTGHLPFESDDSLEVIHGHIARTPASPHERRPAIPLPLSDMVMRLLAKAAEERYQSAAVLVADLSRWKTEWEAGRDLSPAASGRSDAGDRFLLPQRLYGRERPLAQVLEAFELVGAGPSQLLLVSGYAGVGKTSLIRELYRPSVGRHGRFIAGKFDQVTSVPYGALIQAFRELIQQVLTEDEAQVAAWRDRLTAGLGNGVSVLVEVVPEFVAILGPQPPAPALGATETQNRFRLVIRSLIRILARKEHPLVVFLDDLHWADSATLNLLEPLLSDTEIEALMLIGAFRDREIGPDHPLTRALGQLEAAGVATRRVSLEPLALPDLVSLVRDTLHCDLEAAEPLARLVAGKTGGNPFFVGQFLRALREAELLRFDYERERWTFEMDAIASAGMTDNVIDLMTRKIQRLRPGTQRVLTLASCIGSPFDLQTLAIVSEQTPDAVAADLTEAIEEGLVLTTATATAYAFLHDRVQQSAYALIPSDQQRMAHLTVGRLLQSTSGRDQGDERLFDIVHHLNLGRALIHDPAERLTLARLDLNAGQKAKSATAHEAALGYYTAALEMVSDELWHQDYELAFTLHLEAAESQYLCGNYAVSERQFAVLLERARSSLDKAKVYRLRGLQYENMSRYGDALATARECLRLFGVTFPDTAEERQAALEGEMAAIRSLLGPRPIAALADLPVMSDPATRTVMDILTDIWASTYILGEPVLARLISATMVRLSLVHGNTEDSAYAYVTHAITVGPVRGDYQDAYEFGRLALRVNDRFNDRRRRAKIHQQFHAHVNLWSQPMATCIPYAREACRSGLESGDFLYAAYGAATEAWPAMLSTQDLGRFVDDYTANLGVIRKLKAAAFADSLELLLNWARALQGKTRAPLSLSDQHFDESRYVESYRGNPFFTAIHAVTRLQLCYLFGDLAQALEAASTARGVVHHLSGTIWPIEFDFWNGLTLAAAYPDAPEERRASHLAEIDAARQRLGALAEHCRENFLCQSLLLSAEIERVSGRGPAAQELYEQAIGWAEATGMLRQQGLANELCARFWRDRGQHRVAAAYVAAARQAYAGWGAAAKVADLDRRYAAPGEASARDTGSDTGGSPTLAEVSSIDLATVVKAARVLAGEMELERLLTKMLSIAIQNAGAERGVLVLEHDGAPRVHAHGSGDRVTVAPSGTPLSGADSVPVVIVNHVRRKGEGLVLVDARADERYRHDPYVLAGQPRSVLVAPLVNQGRLLGVVYLENNLATGVFTPERLALIQVLASHAAIAIQNAQLYAGLKREVADRTRMEWALRTVSEGTAALTGLPFFQAVARLAAETFGTRYAFIAEVVGPRRDLLTTLAFWQGEAFGENVTYPVAGTPCEAVIAGETCHHPRGLQALFPEDRDLALLKAESYLGVPLMGSSGEVVGHLALIHDQELLPDPQSLAVLRIFASRAGTELERQRADDALRESQLRYSTLAETVPEVLYTNRPDGACDYVSQRFLDYTGMTSEAALGFGWSEAIHPMDRDQTVALWGESARSGRPFDAECRMRRSDGEYRWFRTRSVPMRGLDGTIVRWFGVATDIDDSKRAEEALRAALTEVAQLRDRLQAENIYLLEEVKQHQGFEEIVGRSPALQRVLRQVEQVAPTDTTVLVTGETGTGKELIARAIHNLSARKHRPMVTVNCGAISAGLVESELFGHEKGAFTGAVSRKVGRFELASGGTIFLDEIGDFSLDLQVKLLRVLQEGEFQRVGGSATIKVDVRVIAATHKDLDAAVEDGRFRADLFYRLNVFPIRTPPLRERQEDIPALVRYFVMKYTAKTGKRVDTVPKSVLDSLGAYAWPGNVRELANVLERSVIVSRGNSLELGEWMAMPVETRPVSRDSGARDFSREQIIEALERAGWRVSGPRGAAHALGLKPTTLEARMKRLGISRPSTTSQSS